MSFPFISPSGLCCFVQASASVTKTLQEDTQLPQDGSQAEESGDLCSGENHKSR